jgi:hypothetical protein
VKSLVDVVLLATSPRKVLGEKNLIDMILNGQYTASCMPEDLYLSRAYASTSDEAKLTLLKLHYYIDWMIRSSNHRGAMMTSVWAFTIFALRPEIGPDEVCWNTP